MSMKQEEKPVETLQEFELDFDQTIQNILDDCQVDLVYEIYQANPALDVRTGLSKAPGAEFQRDAVAIITAAAALTPMVVPIVVELIKRLCPHVESETIIEEGTDGRQIIRITRKET
jgi:hypothetical protein